MYIRLRHYNVLHTITTSGRGSASQLWHRDQDDLHYILKVFVYLSDVDDGAGPFMYAAGTHFKKKLLREPTCFLEDGYVTRSDDTQMAEVIPPKRWIKCVGAKVRSSLPTRAATTKVGWPESERLSYKGAVQNAGEYPDDIK